MSHDHLSAGAKHKKRLTIALSLTASFMIVEAVVGVLANSLVLIADAGHMFTDVVGISLALMAIWFAQRPATAAKTYGYYRVEILSAATNALLLFGVAGYILFEAVQRFRSPPDVASVPLLIVASIGLAVNIVSAWILMSGAGESLNVKGAFLEVVSDILGSVGAIAAGLIILTTGWQYADPLFAAGVGLFIIPRTWRLMAEAVNVLLEGTPKGLELNKIQDDILKLDGVRSVHDLHAWTLTSGVIALSGHVGVEDGADHLMIISAVDNFLREEQHIEHVTLQLESAALEAQLAACLPGGAFCYISDAPPRAPAAVDGAG